MHKMKHIRTGAIVLGALSILYVGAYLHAPLLSLIDGVRPVHSRWSLPDRRSDEISTTPLPGFVLSPADAVRIHQQLGYSPAQWTDWIYADSTSYYVLDSFPREIPACSYYAKKLGVRIHGQTGKFYNTAVGWQDNGYLPLSVSNFVALVPMGTAWDAVVGRFGHAERWPNQETFTNELGQLVQVLTYLLHDGELSLVFGDGRLTNVLRIGRL